jgi:hypothetical protein
MGVWLVGAVLWVAGSAGVAEPCTEQRGFDRGRAGLERAAHCDSDDYAAAWRLGGAMAELVAERDALAAGQGARAAEARRAAARRMRQLEVDIEAIRGVLQLRRIVVEGPVREAGAPAQGGGAARAGSGEDTL